MALMSTQKLKQKGTKRIRRTRDTQEIVRFWWTIYRELVTNRRLLGGLLETYDRMKKGSKRRDLDLYTVFMNNREKEKEKGFYAPWGDVTQVTFVAWWKDHRELFIEEPIIQKVPNEGVERAKDRLYVSLNLKKPHYKLLSALRSYILAEQKRLGLCQFDTSAVHSKRKAKREVKFRYNEDPEIHLPTFRELYRFFTTVYVPVLYSDQADLTGDVMKGKTLLTATRRQFAGKPMPAYLQLSRTATPQQQRSVLKTLRRYVLKLDSLCVRVALGEFP